LFIIVADALGTLQANIMNLDDNPEASVINLTASDASSSDLNV
jgi:hypothetical protein